MTPENEARAEIAVLLGRYPLLADRGEAEALVTLFTAEGTFELPDGQRVTGTAALREMYGRKDGPQRMRHHMTSSAAILEGPNAARATTYFIVFVGEKLDHWGCWEDRLRREPDAGWRLQERVVCVEGSVENSWFRQSPFARTSQQNP